MRTLPLGPGAVAVFTAGGGAPLPYGTGNVGPHVGDDPDRVRARRQALVDRFGPITWMTQVHGATVAHARHPGEAGEADALVADADDLVPAVMVADCAPVLLASASGRVRAAVHVGRAGLVAGVLPAALDRVRSLTDEPIFAAIGPHICAGCYEVGEDLAVQAEPFGARATTRRGTPAVDLEAGIRRQLAAVAAVEHDGRCTLESPELYSYRRARVTGRFAGLAVPTRRAR